MNNLTAGYTCTHLGHDAAAHQQTKQLRGLLNNKKKHGALPQREPHHDLALLPAD